MDGSSLDFSGKGNCGRWLAEVISAVGPPGGPREAYRVNRSLTPGPYHPVCDLTPSIFHQIPPSNRESSDGERKKRTERIKSGFRHRKLIMTFFYHTLILICGDWQFMHILINVFFFIFVHLFDFPSCFYFFNFSMEIFLSDSISVDPAWLGKATKSWACDVSTFIQWEQSVLYLVVLGHTAYVLCYDISSSTWFS